MPGLHGDEDGVGRGELGGVGGGAGGVDREVAGETGDAKAVLAHGAEVVAAGDEGDVSPASARRPPKQAPTAPVPKRVMCIRKK